MARVSISIRGYESDALLLSMYAFSAAVRPHQQPAVPSVHAQRENEETKRDGASAQYTALTAFVL